MHTTGAQARPPFCGPRSAPYVVLATASACWRQPCRPPLHGGVMGTSEEFTRCPDGHPLDYTASRFLCRCYPGVVLQ